MYWERFDELFGAFSRRQAVDDLRTMRDAIITGIWGNSNYDGDGKSPSQRPKLLEHIHEWYYNGVAEIYGDEPEEFEIDQDDPFFKAMQLPGVPEVVQIDEVRAEKAQEQAKLMKQMVTDQD
jgi:hypothetical protein